MRKDWVQKRAQDVTTRRHRFSKMRFVDDGDGDVGSELSMLVVSKDGRRVDTMYSLTSIVNFRLILNDQSLNGVYGSFRVKSTKNF